MNSVYSCKKLIVLIQGRNVKKNVLIQGRNE
jgi:hypothetical protein